MKKKPKSSSKQSKIKKKKKKKSVSVAKNDDEDDQKYFPVSSKKMEDFMKKYCLNPLSPFVQKIEKQTGINIFESLTNNKREIKIRLLNICWIYFGLELMRPFFANVKKWLGDLKKNFNSLFLVHSTDLDDDVNFFNLKFESSLEAKNTFTNLIMQVFYTFCSTFLM